MSLLTAQCSGEALSGVNHLASVSQEVKPLAAGLGIREAGGEEAHWPGFHNEHSCRPKGLGGGEGTWPSGSHFFLVFEAWVSEVELRARGGGGGHLRPAQPLPRLQRHHPEGFHWVVSA